MEELEEEKEPVNQLQEREFPQFSDCRGTDFSIGARVVLTIMGEKEKPEVTVATYRGATLVRDAGWRLYELTFFDELHPEVVQHVSYVHHSQPFVWYEETGWIPQVYLIQNNPV